MSIKILAKDRLRKERAISKRTTEEIASKVRISVMQLYRIEQRKQGTDLKTARRFCILYQKLFVDLFKISENKE